MPAPTALLRRPEELAEAASVPLPQDEDDELLLDAPDMALSNTTANVPTGIGNDTEMLIDEEGRPRFAPAKNIVRITLNDFEWIRDVLTTLGWSNKS